MRARILLVLALASGGCAAKDPVLAVLAGLEEAAEDRDADALREWLADDFRSAEGADRAEAHALARRSLAGYESVRLEVYDVKVTQTDAEAQVRARVDFTGSARRLPGLDGLLPPSASYVFDLRLARRGEAWKVTSAEWRSALPAPAP